MEFHSHDCGSIPASLNISFFRGPSGVDEYHLIVRPTEYASIDTQLAWVVRAYRNALESAGLNARTAVLRRFFCSDLANQAAALKGCPYSNPEDAEDACAVSWVGQPPVPPAKVALWAYHVNDPACELDKAREPLGVTLQRGELAHHWSTGLTCSHGTTSCDQTRGIFEQYDARLRERRLSLSDHVIRTWLFVDNIDANYQGLVVARRKLFAERGLTPQTHFIASSGIEGSPSNVAARVVMDAYAISGVRAEQIEFLAARDHLSPTHIYGVTFERGTSVAYRDRKQVFISGTASIDCQGNILHPGDVSRQLDRTLENVEALLKQAGATLEDMGVFIVYVRDASDHDVARRKMRERFGHVPMEVVVARVCRSGWLIEVEGMAVVPTTRPALPTF